MDHAVGAFDRLRAEFRWSLPARFNIAEACCDRFARTEPGRTALIRYDADGGLTPVSYGALREESLRLAAALSERGVGRGDRVAILLPQSAATVAAHFAAYRLGAIALPLAALFGTDALRFRLADSGASAIVTDAAGLAKLDGIRAGLPALATILCLDGPAPGAEGYREALARAPGSVPDPDTGPDDPALMIFTSGTTGPPKGALHGHRVLLGHLPGFGVTHGPFPSAGDRLWTPSDWAWAGGLLNALLPSLYHGVPVVFGPFRPFDPDEAFALMAGAGVRNAFLPPTALKMMRGSDPARFDLKLRSIGAAGESLGREAFLWARETLGLPVDEFYGQTECNYVIGSSAALGVSRPGAIGKPMPGHEVAVIDAKGDEVPPGDQAIRDEDGYIHFLGRDDDIIISAGYRIGPSEIEDCVMSHPAVALAAAVGRPDTVRTEIVRAFIVLRPGYAPSDRLAEEIRLFVRARLSAAEYPREITFIDEIPMTTTGKVIRRALREMA
jgi:acetyl-CoA synthetase